MVASPPRPLGVSLRYFHHLIDKCGGREALAGLTTAQVCFDYIVPLTKASERSLVDHLITDVSTRHFVSEANWYVSHAWQYLFLETVDSLETFFADQGLADEAVLWFCVFNNNQHHAHSYPFEYWSSTFKTQLTAIGNVVMIMHPWNDPIVLRRSWCVFEVYVAVTMQARFEMAMAPDQLELLVDDMLRLDALRDMLGTIKTEASETTVPSDRDGIFALIRAETSFTAVDQLVFTTILSWMKRTLTTQRTLSRLSPINEARHLLCLANIHAFDFAWDEAIATATRACGLFASHGVDGIDAILATLCLGVACAKRADPESTWRPLFDLLLRRDGLDPTTICDIRLAYADALHAAKRHDVIQDLCYATYTFALTHFGPIHRTTIAVMARLGGALYAFGNLDASASWFRQCVNARLQLLGPDHTATLNSRTFLSCIQYRQGRYAKALANDRSILSSRERTHGLLHADTMLALVHVANCHIALGQWHRANDALLQLRERAQQQPLPPTYAMHVTYLHALLYWSRGCYVRTKYYLETAFAASLEHLAPSSTEQHFYANVLYRCLLDPVFGAHMSRRENVWTSLRVFFQQSRLDPEAWWDEACVGCHERPRGRLAECAGCTPNRILVCRNCLATPGSKPFCDHDKDDYLWHVPPHRYLLEQSLRECTSVERAATCWGEYAAYCTVNNVPTDEARPFACFEPLATRSWHPLL